MKRQKIEQRQLQSCMIGPLGVADIQLLALGIAVIGEQNRVDKKLLSNWNNLRRQLSIAFKVTVQPIP